MVDKYVTKIAHKIYTVVSLVNSCDSVQLTDIHQTNKCYRAYY